jgi:hypothetical protein
MQKFSTKALELLDAHGSLLICKGSPAPAAHARMR